MSIAVAPEVKIREVTGKAELRTFVDYPNQLYAGVPQFVPAFYGDDLADWDEKKNPAMVWQGPEKSFQPGERFTQRLLMRARQQDYDHSRYSR